MYIEIETEYDVKEIAKDISNYVFNNPITVQELQNLVEELSPNQYRELIYRDVLEKVEEELPDDLVNVLLTADLSYSNIARYCKLSENTLKDFIDNHISKIDGEYLIQNQNITFEQFKHILHNGIDIYAESLGNVIGHLRNIEYAKYVLKNWNSINAFYGEYDNDFRSRIFVHFGSVLLSDEDCTELFGFVRPTFSTEDLRNQGPCPEGWKRAYKWAGRNDKQYTWNEFIARHVLANQDDIKSAINDLEWLADSVADDKEYFY